MSNQRTIDQIRQQLIQGPEARLESFKLEFLRVADRLSGDQLNRIERKLKYIRDLANVFAKECAENDVAGAAETAGLFSAEVETLLKDFEQMKRAAAA